MLRVVGDMGSAPRAGLGHDEYASAVRIEPLPERLYDASIRLWQDSGLTRPWNDPEADLRRAAGGGSSCVLAAIGDDDGLLATAMVGHDGHRGWVYYLAVDAAQRGRGLGRQMMEACEDWVRSRGIPKIQLMVRATNRGTIGFYEHLGYADSQVVVLGRRLDG
jgi:ribosomal protein S18 acetylase RimI-like enzyme